VENYDIFIDLGAQTAIDGKAYKVVRLGDPLIVPSTGQISIPQQLIGTAIHRHSNGALAHFRFIPNIDSGASIDAKVYGLPMPSVDMVRAGDRLVYG